MALCAVRFRGVSPVTPRPREGLMTEPTAGAQRRRQEPLFVPLNGHCRRCLNNRAVGCGQLVIGFGVPEGKSEVSYLSQFHLLNATGGVYLNL